MKDLLVKRRNLTYYDHITLNEECSVIIQVKLPPKLKAYVTLFHVVLENNK